MVSEAIAQAQATLRDAAKEHKRLERLHRKEARRLMQAAEGLASLEGAGVRVVIGTDGGQSQ